MRVASALFLILYIITADPETAKMVWSSKTYRNVGLGFGKREIQSLDKIAIVTIFGDGHVMQDCFAVNCPDKYRLVISHENTLSASGGCGYTWPASKALQIMKDGDVFFLYTDVNHKQKTSATFPNQFSCYPGTHVERFLLLNAPLPAPTTKTPAMKKENEALCSFCLEPFQAFDHIKRTRCGHYFCWDKCLCKWIEKGNDSCPMCRQSIGKIVDMNDGTPLERMHVCPCGWIGSESDAKRNHVCNFSYFSCSACGLRDSSTSKANHNHNR